MHTYLKRELNVVKICVGYSAGNFAEVSEVARFSTKNIAENPT